ncbi:hypothetical protein F5148DRAFT_1284400 [Russula earlei]|uniref:Uncharacterized protein n=1 Tax=Russula earlei TaxID=71964 RepID=A0ACC0U8W5_9AGAM|nr:hypothetical protein F5148DRAFT_1284400 [Russula earlei]
MSSDDITPGDIVTVNNGVYGRREGLVIGSYYDYLGRQIVEVQFEPGDVYRAWYPSVTRVKRTIYTRSKPQTIERHVYW